MTGKKALALAVCAAALVGSTGCSESTKDEPIPPVGTWTATGSMAVPRSHADGVAPLASGKVLVAGGDFASSPTWDCTAAAELYDPATGTWSTAAPMTTKRCCHCLIGLPSGKVLAAGGHDMVTVLATAEVYDPASNTWTPTASSMTVGHNCTRCVLLNSGKVLIAGGGKPGGISADAELYDPDTGLFTPTGSMATVRYFHAATLLASGKVLVTGGCMNHLCTSWTATAELYDPVTGLWSDAGTMPFPVVAHTATPLASGKVLVAGGCLGYGGTSAGDCASGVDRRAILYDPVAKTWSTTGSLSVGRLHHAALLLDSGEVLVAGGTYFSGGGKTTERYDPATGLWTAGPATNGDHGSRVMSAKLPNGKWLVVGGMLPTYPSTTFTGAAEIFSP